ncbi:hypothetical protein C9374_006809 [Naegleria lovaniensis]|uniref:Uncharacterized protein n=1 Tax=Naegleria lovaniensis TaxID=51637 RepID=A0AA88KPL1_NAELO|nr:uncharacterized protein C9374_006809 [Naegleria lovaniensis]KAG2393278.1 hypothetical protein C9374_006809 [Naegleria lovaniensis]
MEFTIGSAIHDDSGDDTIHNNIGAVALDMSEHRVSQPHRVSSFSADDDSLPISISEILDPMPPQRSLSGNHHRMFNNNTLADNHRLSINNNNLSNSNIPSSTMYEQELEAAAMHNLSKQLTEKQRELERKEMEILQLQNQMKRTGRKKNFPICCPFIHHNISGIPNEFGRRKITYFGFVSWLLFSLVLVLNCVTAYITVFYPPGYSLDVTDMMKGQYLVISTAAIFILPPVHFFITYYPLYRAMETASVPRFILFLFCYLISILFCLFGISGFMTYGVSGVMAAIYYYPKLQIFGSVPGFICNVVMSFVWLLMAIDFIVIFIMGIVSFKNIYGSLSKMRDYGRGFVNDEL